MSVLKCYTYHSNYNEFSEWQALASMPIVIGLALQTHGK